jgi:flagellar hook assembly protein FlgD
MERRLRKPVAALLLAMLAALAAFAPAASAAAPAGAKVVIIVGATHGATAGYRADADKAYAEAIKYTSNVVKVYSPNATWSKVKSATTGASIVIYFGHGNGWPSPYTYDAAYKTKDGFGLNATAGNGDYNNTYYGEPYVSTLALAPNAVIILGHLCYASGNSEPGNAAPTATVARQRVDNYAAGFLKGGKARAVIADGHGGPEPYIKALFTTHATIEEVWRSAPNFHNHVKAFASSRTSGATAYTDTDSSTAGYYRSLVAKPGLTTDDVTGATWADTSVDPTKLVVPGNAQAGAAGAGLYGDPGLTPDGEGLPPATIPTGTRLRVVLDGIAVASTGGPSVRVQGIDDPSIDGWVATADLVPKDSSAPRVWGVESGVGRLSPNGDGVVDDATMTGNLSEPAHWTAKVKGSDGTVLDTASGTGGTFSITWDGLDGGDPVADGAYTVTVDAADDWGNAGSSTAGKLTVDTVAPEIGTVTPASDPEPWFSPNGDGVRDTIALTAGLPESGSLMMRVVDGDNALVRKSITTFPAGTAALSWDGRDGSGDVVPDGLYNVRLTFTDPAGNTGITIIRTVRVTTTLGFVTTSKTIFYPQDLDVYAPSTVLGYRLARAATVTWTIRNAAGAVVDTILDGEAVGPGTYTHVFDGMRMDGLSRLPAGKYSALLSATDGLTTISQAVAFQMNAYGITDSDSTPARGQKLTLYATPAEPQTGTPRLYITQPGKPVWSVPMVKTSTGKYKAVFTLKTGGGSGTVSLRVTGADRAGRKSSTTLSSHIH